MTPYHCNEAILQLPSVRILVDVTRQVLDIVTEDGVELQFVIARVPVTASLSLAASVEEGVAERMRSLRGFQLVSSTEREYPEVTGVEVRVTYVDKERGPMFIHEFHCVLGGTRIGYHGSCRLAHAAACDEWMQLMLQDLKLRE